MLYSIHTVDSDSDFDSELRFPTTSMFGRDLEISPTKNMSTYLYNSPYINKLTFQ